MASQPKLKKLSDNNSYYECEVIKASTLRPMNKSISEKDRVVYESRCKLKLFSTYVKVEFYIIITSKSAHSFLKFK